jgi:hypothetical protein
LCLPGNIATNVAALERLAAVGQYDRALLSLPASRLPFAIGNLTPLAFGTAKSSYAAARSPAVVPPSLRMDGFAPAISALSIETASCS